jgi:hypothetical protein
MSHLLYDNNITRQKLSELVGVKSDKKGLIRNNTVFIRILAIKIAAIKIADNMTKKVHFALFKVDFYYLI